MSKSYDGFDILFAVVIIAIALLVSAGVLLAVVKAVKWAWMF